MPTGQLPGRKDQTHKTALDRNQALPKPKAKQAAEVGGHASQKAQVIIGEKNRYEVKQLKLACANKDTEQQENGEQGSQDQMLSNRGWVQMP